MSGSFWYLGLLAGILSSLVSTFGKQLVRLSEVRLQQPRHRRVMFVLGLFLHAVVGPIFDVLAHSMASQSLLAPMGGFGLVLNALLAPCLLKETMTRRCFSGCFLVIIGTVLTAASAKHNEMEYTIHRVEVTLLSKRVVLYIACLFAWLLAVSRVARTHPTGSTARGVAFGVIAGSISGNVWCGKSAIELIKTGLEGESIVWLHWLTYTLVVGAIVVALSSLAILTRQLKVTDALLIVPVATGSDIVVSSISAGVVLCEFWSFGIARLCLFSSAMFLICTGIYLLSLVDRSRRPDSDVELAIASVTGAFDVESA